MNKIAPPRYVNRTPIIIVTSALGPQSTVWIQEWPQCSLSFQSDSRVSHPLPAISEKTQQPLYKRIVLPHPGIPDVCGLLLPVRPSTIDLQVQSPMTLQSVRLQRRNDIVDGRRNLVLLAGGLVDAL